MMMCAIITGYLLEILEFGSERGNTSSSNFPIRFLVPVGGFVGRTGRNNKREVSIHMGA